MADLRVNDVSPGLRLALKFMALDRGQTVRQLVIDLLTHATKTHSLGRGGVRITPKGEKPNAQ